MATHRSFEVSVWRRENPPFPFGDSDNEQDNVGVRGSKERKMSNAEIKHHSLLARLLSKEDYKPKEYLEGLASLRWVYSKAVANSRKKNATLGLAKAQVSQHEADVTAKTARLVTQVEQKLQAIENEIKALDTLPLQQEDMRGALSRRAGLMQALEVDLQELRDSYEGILFTVRDRKKATTARNARIKYHRNKVDTVHGYSCVANRRVCYLACPFEIDETVQLGCRSGVSSAVASSLGSILRWPFCWGQFCGDKFC